MECLTGYIGLSESVGKVESGLYLNALPGVSLNSVNGIANREQVDYEGVFKEVEQRAINKFRTFFTRELNNCFRISKREIVECLICENRALLAVSLWYLMGAELMIERINSERKNRFTTVEKKEAQDLRDEFMDTFFQELSTAVSGIDINNSPCMIDEDIECTNIVTFKYELP